jgi:LysM repeat protein
VKHTVLSTLLLSGLALAAPALAETPLEKFYQPLSSENAKRIEYRVKEGDTLFGIAQRILGDPYKARLLQDVNKIEDPFQLEPGQKLRIPVPALGILYSIQKEEGADLVEVTEQHRFKAGDRFRLRLTANLEGYLYIFNRKPNGDIERLNPESRKKVSPFAEYVLPSKDDEWYRFDNERGSEELLILISPTRLTELDSDLAADAARQKLQRLVAANEGTGAAIGEGREGMGRSLVLASPVGESLVLAHRIVLRKQ